MGGWGGGFRVLKRRLGPGVAVLGPPFNLNGMESVTQIPFPSPEAPPTPPPSLGLAPFLGKGQVSQGRG